MTRAALLSGRPGVSSCAQSTAFLARTSGLDATHTSAYANLICGLVTDGVWAKLDVLYTFATQDSATALLNLVSTSFAATVVGTPTFAADGGYTGTAAVSPDVHYLESNFNPTDAGGLFAQDSAHASMWSGIPHYDAAPMLGQFSSPGSLDMYLYTDNNFYARINDAESDAGVSDTTGGVGFYLGTRTATTVTQKYVNGVAAGPPTANPSTGLLDDRIKILGQNNLTSLFQAKAASFGGALTATDVAKFYNRLHTYLHAVGAI